MATECVIEQKGVSGTLSRRYTDESISEKFRISLDTASRNLPSIMALARAANPTQFPLRGQAWPANPFYGLYADSFNFEPMSDLLKDWYCIVAYIPLKAGEPNTEGNDNPLQWPATYSLEWIEREEAVTKARNRQKIGHPSNERAVGTLGAVVNSALQELEEGIFRTVRRPVVCMHKNVATLDELFDVETQYADSTNNDTVYGVGPRRYQYLTVDAPGTQVANGISFYPRTIRVVIEKTTDFTFNNVGWHNLDFDGKKVKYKVLDQDENGAAISPPKYVDPTEPGFLTLTGGRSETHTSLDYGSLQEKPYAGLLI